MSGTPHGNAQWANREHLEDNGFSITRQLLADRFILGKFVPVPSDSPHPMHQAFYEGRKYRSLGDFGYLGVKEDGHIITVAPTRSGKGVGFVIPNLLNYDGSAIVIDPKGENFAKTVDYRENHLGQEVWCFDPFRLEQDWELHGFALLKRVKAAFDLLDDRNEEAASLYADVSRIAEAMVIRKRDEKDPFFNTAARSIIKNLILLILWASPRDKRCPPISKLRHLVVDSLQLDRLIKSVKTAIVSNGGASPRNVVAIEAVHEIEGYRDNRDVMATVLMQTEFLEDDDVFAILDGDSSKCEKVFDPEMLNLSGQKHTIYLIVPPHHLERQSRFLRLIITLCMDAIMRRDTAFKDVGKYAHTLFMLDEIAQLGRLEPVQKAVSLAAGYGMTLWMFWQDLAQLKGLYPEDYTSFLSNAKIQQFFGCNDIETAKYISERCGPRTRYTYSENDQVTTRGFHVDGSSGITVNKIAGEFVRPSEILRADASIVFLFSQGCFPSLCEKIRYYNDGTFSKRQR